MRLDGEAVESVAVFSKSDSKNQVAQSTTSLRESLWWIPVLWRAFKWLRERDRKEEVTSIRLRKDEEVIIRKKESPL
jgi:hypothetical protein